MGFMDKAIDFGAKPFGGKLTKALTGASELERGYFGGDKKAYDATRAEYGALGAGLAAEGQTRTGEGYNLLGEAYTDASGDHSRAKFYENQGYGIGQQAMQSQDMDLYNLQSMAGRNTDSLAQAQLQAGLEQTQRTMAAQAASARGGNQAAALRNAQATGAQMALQTNQQAAMMRAQEQQAQLAREMAAQQYAGNVHGGRAQMGYGMQGQGLGLAQGATQGEAQIANQMAGIGLEQGGQALGAYGLRNQVDSAQLGTDVNYNSALAAGSSPLVVANAVTNGVAAYYGAKRGGGQQGQGQGVGQG